jgi:hypothetical protein
MPRLSRERYKDLRQIAFVVTRSVASGDADVQAPAALPDNYPTFYVWSSMMPALMREAAPSTPSFSPSEPNEESIFRMLMSNTASPTTLALKQSGTKTEDEQAAERRVSYIVGRIRLQNLCSRMLEIKDDISTSDLAKVIEALRNILSAHDYESFNSLLKSLDVQGLSTIAIVTLLRSSYFYRRFVDGWDAFLNAARDELNRRNLPTAKILRGLTA